MDIAFLEYRAKTLPEVHAVGNVLLDILAMDQERAVEGLAAQTDRATLELAARNTVEVSDVAHVLLE
jgi:hypothetical protein